MATVNVITVNGIDYAIIDDGGGGFTSMTKAEYDAQQSQLATPTP